jgi:hypothetical protein
VRIDIEETLPVQGGIMVTIKTNYFPDTKEILVQELHNGAPWNGVFYTPTIPHWLVDAYKVGVATELGKDLSNEGLKQMESRYRKPANRDYNADVKRIFQLHVKEIQSALNTNVPFTHAKVELGNEPFPEFPIDIAGKLIEKDIYYPIRNRDFVKGRNIKGRGGDFLVYSDLALIKLDKPMAFDLGEICQ